ncbi:MAG: helix-turn-helix domain-containing protein [Myxococcales bacterium]|nr:helix-turn-helix domain-containing protein [Myxococcales bacterium]
MALHDTARPPAPDEWSDVPLLLTRSEAAKLLRVDDRTIARWDAIGRLPSVKLTPGRPGRKLYRREDLRRLVEQAAG